jgi:hypothetical protein
MVALILVFCLVGSPSSCTEEHPYIQSLSLVGCLTQGQQVAQEWLAEHPKWALSRWRCEAGVPAERPA